MNPSQKTKADAGETSKPTAGNVPVSITKNGELVTISLRDYFAAKALQGMLCNGFMPDQIAQNKDRTFDYTKAAFALADKMLKAREQQ